MQAIRIEPSVGRCKSCHKFRNNMEWQVEDKVVCMDCFTILKNQRLIDKVIKQDLTPRSKHKKVVTRGNSEAKQIIFDILTKSQMPLLFNEIKAEANLSTTTVKIHLNSLIKEGFVICNSKKRWRRYVDKERKNLLDAINENDITFRVYKVLLEADKRLTAKWIVDEYSMHRQSVKNSLNYLYKKGIVDKHSNNDKDRSSYYAVKENPGAYQILQTIKSPHIENQIVNYMKENKDKLLSESTISLHFGKNPKHNRFIRRCLDRLIAKGEVIRVKHDGGRRVYYELVEDTANAGVELM